MPEINRSPDVCGCQTKTRWCIFLIFIILVVAQEIVGGVYYSDCPREPFIPVYLTGPFVVICVFVWFPWCCSGNSSLICFALIIIFFFGWFIAGSVAIYSIYEPNYKTTTKSDPYCNKTLYLFAFWSTNVTYILLALLICTFCCCREERAPENEALLQT